MTHLLNNHIAVSSPSMFEEVSQHIREMLDANDVRESDSPYSSNIFSVCKPSGALRFCIDW